jgi:L-fuconolactonase
MRIDSHHHVWDLAVRPQDWITGEAMQPLLRDFTLSDLAPLAAKTGIDRTVIVQTVADPGETPELLDLAADEEMVAGVVGWLDLESPAVDDDLAGLLEHAHARKLVAIRDLAQYKDDVEWLGRADVISALQLLGRHDLTYDLLTLPPQLPAALQAVTACPDTTFVLDHMSKPYIAAGEIEPWRRAVRALAARPNVACKVSGMFTEADWRQWTTEQFRPYVDVLLEAFGPERLMFGSDWPVSTLAATYEQVVDVAGQLTAHLSAEEQAEFWAGTATRFYRLTT